MKTLRLTVLASLLASCTFDVPDLNRPGIETLQNPTPSQVAAIATGLLIGARKGFHGDLGVVSEWGILGRESLVLTSSDPRFVTELLQGPGLDPGSGNFGGNFWLGPYSNIRSGNLLLHALDDPSLTGLTDAEKEATRGFAKTIQAYDYLQVIDSHDVNGAVLMVDVPLGTEPGPIVTSTDQVFTFIEGLLDDAQMHLAKGGTAFPFALGTGFAGFDTPPNFTLFNRALRARVAVYHGAVLSGSAQTAKYNEALTELAASFIVPSTPTPPNPAKPTPIIWPGLGVFHQYGSASGDTPNDLNATEILCHPSTVTDAELLQPVSTACAGAPPLPLTCYDNRVSSKVKKLSAPVALSNHSSNYGFSMYPDSTSRIPIIRNEELILLRAEANIALGNIGLATQDIDYIRVNSGGLPPSTGLNATNILDELLKQKRYSLLFEGGHRWIDLRRYGKLAFCGTQPCLAQDIPADVIHAAYPVPLIETQARP